MVVVGDITQIDLVSEKDSGLKDALKKLNKVNDIGFIELSEKDVVRHDLVKKLLMHMKNIKVDFFSESKKWPRRIPKIKTITKKL